MRLEPYLKPDQVTIVERCADLADLLGRLSSVAAKIDPAIDTVEAVRLFTDREKQQPTSTPEGVAFPHAMLSGPRDTLVIVALCRPGVRFAARNHPPADVIFCMIGSADRPFEHVRLLARLARIALAPGALAKIRSATSPNELFERLIAEDRTHG